MLTVPEPEFGTAMYPAWEPGCWSARPMMPAGAAPIPIELSVLTGELLFAFVILVMLLSALLAVNTGFEAAAEVTPHARRVVADGYRRGRGLGEPE